MIVYRNVAGQASPSEIFDIKEATYTGKDMGERKIVATIKWPSPIDFQIGDYVELEIADLIRVQGAPNGGYFLEKFYIYTMPTIKKVARNMSVGDAFEHTVTFYPRQYELGTVMMRDLYQEQAVNNIIYTGYDEFSFYSGAKGLLDRIMACLEVRYPHTGTAGVYYWTYDLADDVNEYINTALEKYQFDFSSNTTLEALVKLSDADGIDTVFFINERKIYVGYKCPMVCSLDSDAVIQADPYIFHYGKTSNKAITDNNGGGLVNITKAVGNASPITRLFAYGSTRNLNRFYCSDRLTSGRYVNRLMLPSFDQDGVTDYIDSPSGIAKFGVREGKKTFEDIYPSLRYITYGDLRQIQYVLKLELSGEAGEQHGPLCRVQCYRVEPSSYTGRNHLVPAYPDKPLCVCIHANGKVCKVILRTSLAEQQAIDGSTNIPPVTGSCYCVHQGTEYNGSSASSTVTVQRFANYADYKAKAFTTRSLWFGNINTSGLTPDQEEDLSTFQINYGDDARITDVYVCDYSSGAPLYDNQTTFTRDGYSAYCWPRINGKHVASQSDAIRVNEVLAATPITQADTDWATTGSNSQKSFDIFLRDVGFKINEQTPMGTLVHIVGQTFNLEFIDGDIAGVTFEAAEQKATGSMIIDSICCAFNDDGSENSTFVSEADDPALAAEALTKGAIWRITVMRNDADYDQYGLIIPNQFVQCHEGDHLVFLNIYMPDIYIHAAENRMLKEAQNYLNDNDNGDVDYTMDFDQIRLAQIPKLGLQMREGIIMRIVDEDLDIQTEKESKYLFKDDSGVTSQASFLEYTYQAQNERIYGSTTVTDNIKIDASGRVWNVIIDDIGQQYTLLGESECPIAVRVTQHFSNSDDVVVLVEPTYYTHLIREDYTIDAAFSIPRSIRNSLTPQEGMMITGTDYEVIVNYYTETQVVVPAGSYVPVGKVINCCADPVTEFQSEHYYIVVLDTDKNLVPVSDGDDNPIICLADTIGEQSSGLFFPTAKCTAVTEASQGYGLPPTGYYRYAYSFTLPKAFNDAVPYYVAVRYIAQSGSPDYATIRLLSIYESNTSDGSTELNYVDLTMDDITIQISSSGREYSLNSTSGGNRSGSGSSSGSVADDKKVTANLKQKQRATVWQQMSQEVKNNSMLSEQNEVTAATLAQNARRSFRNLDALRSSIFDPDGTIADPFLQTMMLQVGADSMNYSLDKTRVFNGTLTNITLTKSNDVWTLAIGTDTLRHFVYTDPIDTWYVNTAFSSTLDAAKTYYIAVKASRTGSSAIWVASETQHKVDEDNDYWYFNYGIVLPANGNQRSIMETRGNAYMYGDNVIAGKISTIDGNSYFDLTGNRFKLGSALNFANGVLTIDGVNDSDPDSILSRLGLAEEDIHDLDEEMETKATTALVEEVREDLQAQIDGAIDTWFYAGVPTLNNLPASQWTDDDTKNLHVGDLYYDKNTGNAYRFLYDDDNDVYLWTLIPDDEIATALKMAADAQATADGKMAFFTGNAPLTQAYQVGDMWQDATTGRILYAINDRAAGGYVASDWVSSSLYAETLALMEQGGENLIGEDNPFQMDPASGDYRYFPLVGDLSTIDGSSRKALNQTLLEANTKYVFSFDKASRFAGSATQFSAGLIWKDANSAVQVDLKRFDIGSTRQTAIYTTPAIVTGATKCAFIIYAGPQGSTANVGLTVSNMMLQQGEKASAYSTYKMHLTEALKGQTDIAGGLILTNLLMLRRTSGATSPVNAGMSGLASENVLMWGGGTYAEALAALAGGTQLPVLLTKSGSGSRIGCFKVEDDEEIAVHDGDDLKRVIVTSKSISTIPAGLPSSVQIQAAGALASYSVNQGSANITTDQTVLSTNFTAPAYGNARVIIPLLQESTTQIVNAGSGNSEADAYVSSIVAQIKKNGTVVASGFVSGVQYADSFCTASAGGESRNNGANNGWINIDMTLEANQQYTLEIVTSGLRVATEFSGSVGVATADYVVQASAAIKAVYTDMRTYLCKDGISIVANSDLSFSVSNDGAVNIVKISGLPTADPHVAGQLWDSNGTMKISHG